MCQAHWDRLREAIKARGLDHLGARNAQEAIAAVITEIEGRGAENDFDPLMSANNMIFSRVLEMYGLGVMGTNPDGSEMCPICVAVKQYENWWIDGPCDHLLKEAQSLGLVPKTTE